MKTIKPFLTLQMFFCILITISAQHLPEIILKVPVLIELDNGTTGSGFFVQDSLNTYLITARHVLFDKKTIISNKIKKDTFVLLSKMIECTYYPKEIDSSLKNSMSIDLQMANQFGLLKKQENADIGIINIGYVTITKDSLAITHYYPFVIKKKSFWNQPIPRNIIESYKNVHVGDDVITIGFPTSLGIQKSPQFDFERPLLRHGIVAGKYPKQNTFIIDCPEYYGNSGGAVFIKYEENGGVYYKLIGVISQFIPFEEKWINNRSGLINTNISDSGYSVVVPIESIFDLFKKE
jgi:hypothetical protein